MGLYQQGQLWVRTAYHLGRAVWDSLHSGIYGTLEVGEPGVRYTVIAVGEELVSDDPVYATPCEESVLPQERFRLFLPEGTYWLYAVPGDDPRAGLRNYYANPGQRFELPGNPREARRGQLVLG